MTKRETVFDRPGSAVTTPARKNVLLILCVLCHAFLSLGCASAPIRSLTKAIRDNDLKGVKAALAAGANVNDMVYNNRHRPGYYTQDTALMYSAWECHSDIVEFLLDRGANVNATDSSGHTALMTAVTARVGGLYHECALRPEIIRLLLNRGADPNAKNNHGQTALMIAATNGCNSPDQASCIETRNLPEVVTALINKAADPNGKDKSGYTPLIYAAIHGYSKIVSLLHNKGAVYPDPPVLLLRQYYFGRVGGWGTSVTVLTDDNNKLESWIWGSSLSIKPGSQTLRLYVRENRGGIPYSPLPQPVQKYVEGRIQVKFVAKNKGIYVVRWDMFENTWKAWVDSYEPPD